jgi:antitoxin (DNA-binding transcriptional repressor) of toxin-antitoxin stability system
MSTITVQDIEANPAEFVHRLEAGETIVVLRDNRPVAEIKPIAAPSTEPRPYGLCAGQFVVPDDFDAPLPEEILREFEGE